MSVVNSEWPTLIIASVDNTPVQATASPIPTPPSVWVEHGSSYNNVSCPPGYACWRPNPTRVIIGAVFGGIAIGLIIASWIALFVVWRRARKARSRATHAIRDPEQRVGRESFNSVVDFYTPDAHCSEDKRPLLLHFGRDSVEGL